MVPNEGIRPLSLRPTAPPIPTCRSLLVLATATSGTKQLLLLPLLPPLLPPSLGLPHQYHGLCLRGQYAATLQCHPLFPPPQITLSCCGLDILHTYLGGFICLEIVTDGKGGMGGLPLESKRVPKVNRNSLAPVWKCQAEIQLVVTLHFLCPPNLFMAALEGKQPC